MDHISQTTYAILYLILLLEVLRRVRTTYPRYLHTTLPASVASIYVYITSQYNMADPFRLLRDGSPFLTCFLPPPPGESANTSLNMCDDLRKKKKKNCCSCFLGDFGVSSMYACVYICFSPPKSLDTLTLI